MKLARKITLALTATIFVVMALYALYLRSKQVILFEGDLQGNATRGAAVRLMIQDIWQTDGPTRAREIVERVADTLENVDVRWVDLAAQPGQPGYAPLLPRDRQALEAGAVLTILEGEHGDDPTRLTYIPMAAGQPAVLEIARHLQREVSFVRASQSAIFVTTLCAVLACSVIAMFLGYWFVGRPVELLRDRARRAGDGDFEGCLKLKQRDEMGELGAEIDDMCAKIAETNQRLAAETEAKLAALERMRHSERLASVGRFASGIAHELGTPLSVVSARAKMIGSDLQQSPQTRAHARVIGEQASRMTDMIRQLLDLSRRRSTRMGAVNVGQCVRTAAEMLNPVASARHVTIEVAVTAAPLVVRLDAGEAQQVLTNVLLNAVQASHEGGRVHIGVEERQATPPQARGGSEGRYVRIVVADDGQGIAPEDLPHVFEPFFTTKGPGEGTGLGLAIAEGIVQDAGGWIEVRSEAGRGTEMAIHLPPAQGTQVAQADSA
ncbi:HAMP domain-containing histidine kinase [Candidatus Binatia bacterium]|nr:HAMP domain-containing histidine kinase [Candidatus Binatia bacterium]